MNDTINLYTKNRKASEHVHKRMLKGQLFLLKKNYYVGTYLFIYIGILFASVHRAHLFPHFFLVHSFSSSFSFYFFLFFTHPLIPKQHRACLFPHETSFLVVCDFKRCDFGNLTKPPKLKKKKMRFGISKWHFAIWKSYLHFEIAKCFFPVLTLTTHSNNRLFILFGQQTSGS